MRLALDWERIKKDTTPQLLRKKIARLTQYVVKAKAKKRRRAGAGAPAESGLRLPGNKNLAQRHEICLAFIRRHNQSCDPWEQPTCGADIGYMRPLECVAP